MKRQAARRVNRSYGSGADVERYLRGPVFEPLKEDRVLFEAVVVDPELGTVVWPNGADSWRF